MEGADREHNLKKISVFSVSSVSPKLFSAGPHTAETDVPEGQ